MSKQEKKRCEWCHGSEIYISYHDTEWGVPVTDDLKLFEFLSLEGAQAGLSWITILKKKSAYQKLFDNFQVKKIVKYTPQKIEKILQNPSIVRNRLKINSVVSNAKAFQKVQQEFESFSHYLWQFVEGKPIINHFKNIKEIPAQTPLSALISKDLKKRGFTFVGSTICYAFIQAVGLVNDHLVTCFRHQEISKKIADSPNFLKIKK